ncbi:hypothetical protein CHUAL_009822 [Chamberlinius hualienensis]
MVSVLSPSLATKELPPSACRPSPVAGLSSPCRPSHPLPQFLPNYVVPSTINCLELNGAHFCCLFRLDMPSDI